MDKFYSEIFQFLQSSGLYIYKVREGHGYISVKTELPNSSNPKALLLLGIQAGSLKEAEKQHAQAYEEITRLTDEFGNYPLIVSEDRWRRQGNMTRSRLLAHLEIFTQIYARNCEVRRIDKITAQTFLEANHSYGDAACKYRYGLYLKRHTGHNTHRHSEQCEESLFPGTLVAVATFSNARKWTKGDKTIRSYEWTRYASLPDVRLSGGMGKILKAFIKEVNPDDIMTYADLEWSEGSVYEQLGFTLEGTRPAVSFIIGPSDWNRTPMSSKATAVVDMPPSARGCPNEERAGVNGSCALDDMPPPARRFFQNFGSNKYRMKLTDYQ